MQFNTLFALTLLAVYARVGAQNDTSHASALTRHHPTPCIISCAVNASGLAGCDLYVASYS